MQFTPEQKLIIGLLCDIHKNLNIRNEYDAEMISDAILSGNEWAIDHEYGQHLGSEIQDPRFKFVSDVMQMSLVIEGSYNQMTEADKATIAEGTRFNPAKVFVGFDGNNESEYMSCAQFYVHKLNRFAMFKEREFNSHSEMVGAYHRMLAVFNEVYDPVHGADRLSAEQIIAIMNEKIHPANR
ncbi:YfbU family protein [Aeromonas sp. 6P]|uniref:YfbU family protein n=1 Tax=Aeromonas sp. 6P TaxID=3452722 RepID=UPI0038E307B3